MGASKMEMKKGDEGVDPQKTSLMFKALSDEIRVKFVMELMDGEKCACDLMKALHLTQPALSHHAQILIASGLVDTKRIGRWTHFALNQQNLAEAQRIMLNIYKSSRSDPFLSSNCC